MIKNGLNSCVYHANAVLKVMLNAYIRLIITLVEYNAID